jgi:hypothetical protein
MVALYKLGLKLFATFGSSGALLALATLDCVSLDGQPSGMVLHWRLSSEGRQSKKKGLLAHQKPLGQTFVPHSNWKFLSPANGGFFLRLLNDNAALCKIVLSV